jgi:hypothetical protein
MQLNIRADRGSQGPKRRTSKIMLKLTWGSILEVACEQDRLVEYDLVGCIVDQDRRSRLVAAARERAPRD